MPMVSVNAEACCVTASMPMKEVYESFIVVACFICFYLLLLSLHFFTMEPLRLVLLIINKYLRVSIDQLSLPSLRLIDVEPNKNSAEEGGARHFWTDEDRRRKKMMMMSWVLDAPHLLALLLTQALSLF